LRMSALDSATARLRSGESPLIVFLHANRSSIRHRHQAHARHATSHGRRRGR
jgi:hypothetical protein